MKRSIQPFSSLRSSAGQLILLFLNRDIKGRLPFGIDALHITPCCDEGACNGKAGKMLHGQFRGADLVRSAVEMAVMTEIMTPLHLVRHGRVFGQEGFRIGGPLHKFLELLRDCSTALGKIFDNDSIES